MINVSILGSTGSIGRNALEVIQSHPEEFRVVGLAARSSLDLLAEQARRFNPEIIALEDPQKAGELKSALSGLKNIEILAGLDGLRAVASHPGSSHVLCAIVGSAGLVPALDAVRAGKTILLANKEVLVMGGEIFMREARLRGVQVIPVDSEHSAVFQCLEGRRRDEIARIVLTASGGPFLTRPLDEIAGVTVQEALCHPNWKMGPKITIDSATMMNKGLEMIEAYWLFSVDAERIKVIIHPQSVVHSMVEFVDGSLLAQLGVPDMKIPIQYALSYPRRLNGLSQTLDLARIGSLTFQEPDSRRFPALDLAQECLRVRGTMSSVLNAANEIAVSKFLGNEICFRDITALVESVMTRHNVVREPSLEDVMLSDDWARQEAHQWRP